MAKRFIAIVLSLITLFSITSCSKTPDTKEVQEENPYKLSNNLAPTEMISEVKAFIMSIYMPKDQEEIDNAIERFCKIATEEEINELKSTVGEYDRSKRATLSDLYISMCTPDNSSNRKYKIIATFTIKLNDMKQNILIQFNMDNSVMIESHSIWVNNS